MSATGISGASRKAGFGEATPQQVSREGQNRRIADFGTVVETWLSSLWLVMRKHVTLPEKQRESIVRLRMQKILRFIEEHYAEDITLTDLSMSANISKSECSRCFKLGMNTTPYKYLTEYRLSKAAQLLKKTNEPIGNIAVAVGFHQWIS